MYSLCLLLNLFSISNDSFSVQNCDIVFKLVWFLSRPLPSVLWHCWLGIRKSIQPIEIECCGVGVVICLKQGADCLHMVQLMPLPFENSPLFCLVSIQTGFTFLVLAYPGCSRKVALNGCSSTPLVKKTRHLTVAHNFTKYWPIFKILSLLDSVGNL